MSFVATFLGNAVQVAAELAPWLLLGAGIAGILHIFLPPDFVRRHLGQGSFSNVLKAALFGVPMPLCSCGVIPAAIGLKKDGASDGAAVAFLISTPQTGVDSITVSVVFLGLPFALFKVMTAFITGLIGGMLSNLSPAAGRDMGAPAQPTPVTRRRCRTLSGCFRSWYEFTVNDLLYSIWKWIIVGILVSAAISTFVPQDMLAGKSWATGLAGMFLMLLISMPLYVCATASVPVAASLVVAGMPLGAALVFLMAGPATNMATLGAVYSEFGKRITFIYIGVIAGGSILFGWLFDWLFGTQFGVASVHVHESGTMGMTALLLLVVLFVIFAIRDLRALLSKGKETARGAGEEERLVLPVGGMTCEGCARNVKNALMPQRGVHSVQIDVASGKATVQGHNLHLGELQEAVREAGYEIIGQDVPPADQCTSG